MMNDEELRAFLNSASVGDDSTTTPAPAAEQPRAGAARSSQEQREFKVPSFEELLTFGAPTAAPAQKEEPPAPVSSPAPAPAAAPAPPAAAPAPPAAPPPTNAPAAARDDEEELMPLVLPGFSPEPRTQPPLPPVFQVEKQQAPRDPKTPTVSPAPPAAARHDDIFATHIEPAPTQPVELSELLEPSAPAQPSTRQFQAPAPVPAPQDDDPFRSLIPELFEDEAEASAVADPPYEKIAVTGGTSRSRKALPWIIVGAGVVVATVASVLVISNIRGQESGSSTDIAITTPTETAPSEEPAPAASEAEEPAREDAETATPEPNEAPSVEVGPVFTIPITQWNLSVDKPQRLGKVSYDNLNDQSLTLEIELAASLPESCQAARTGWGLQRAADGSLTVVRPTPRCTDADAAAIYDTVWGLVDSMAKSARPATE